MSKKAYGKLLTDAKPFRSIAGSVLITGGRVIDPANGVDTVLDVALDKGEIVGVGENIPKNFKADKAIDAKGKWVVPGLFDMHVHLREPGREDKETITSGTNAAAAGGFTSVACMPNTTPVLDEESYIRYVLQRGEDCLARIHPMGAISKGLEGKELAPMGEMVGAGAVAVTDDGRAVSSSLLMKHAFNYSKSFGIPVCCHSEDAALAHGGHANEGPVSTKYGLRGIPTIAEDICVARDVMIAEYTGAKCHIMHVSSKGSIDFIRSAKARGVNVTCETAPHYFILTDDAVASFDGNKKMNPPLRSEADRIAVVEGLRDGTIDCIASDHAPHCVEEKDIEFDNALNGVVGLETMVGASVSHLVKTGVLSPSDLIKKMSLNPHRILGVPGGDLSVGTVADITIIDPDVKWTVDPKEFYSKGRNSAFIGFDLEGRAVGTIVGGHLVFEA